MTYTRDQVMACYRVTGADGTYADLDEALAAADVLNQRLGTDADGYGRAVVVPGMAIKYPQPIAATDAGAVALRRVVVPLPLIALGATVDRSVTWSAPMPSAVYRVELAAGAGLVGRAQFSLVPGSQTAAGLAVRITASLLISAGAVLDVTAYA